MSIDRQQYQKDYHKIYDKEYKELNEDKIKEYQKNYHKEYQKKYREKKKEHIRNIKQKWYQDNKELIKEDTKTYYNNRIKNDSFFKLKRNLSTLIKNSIRRNGGVKNKRSCDILGCTINEFKRHLESKFEDWMSWDNYGKYDGQCNTGWDIDHIIPTSSAKTEEDLYRLNYYTNLQPLCSKVNRDIKRDK